MHPGTMAGTETKRTAVTKVDYSYFVHCTVSYHEDLFTVIVHSDGGVDVSATNLQAWLSGPTPVSYDAR